MNETAILQELKAGRGEHPFLHGMKSDHLDILARHARHVEFQPRQLIFRESEAAYQFYLILDGRVAVESHVPRADDIPVQVIGGGDVLGWSWLFPPFTWHFQARALEATRAIVLDGARLLVAAEADHDFGYELMKRIAQIVINRLHATRGCLSEIRNVNDPSGPVDATRAPRHEAATPAAGGLETALARHPFLQGLHRKHLKALAEAAMRSEFLAGESIFQTGGLANRFYLIQQGKVVLETAGPDGVAVPIQVLGAGDVLGWSWLFPPYYWHFDACALERTQSIFLYGTRLREECERNHGLGYELMKRVCQVLIHRLQATRRKLLQLHQARNAATLKT
jgi:CRP/FNR family cyclic AMP-dependent transcriptional regulator